MPKAPAQVSKTSKQTKRHLKHTRQSSAPTSSQDILHLFSEQLLAKIIDMGRNTDDPEGQTYFELFMSNVEKLINEYHVSSKMIHDILEPRPPLCPTIEARIKALAFLAKNYEILRNSLHLSDEKIFQIGLRLNSFAILEQLVTYSTFFVERRFSAEQIMRLSLNSSRTKIDNIVNYGKQFFALNTNFKPQYLVDIYSAMQEMRIGRQVKIFETLVFFGMAWLSQQSDQDAAIVNLIKKVRSGKKATVERLVRNSSPLHPLSVLAIDATPIPTPVAASTTASILNWATTKDQEDIDFEDTADLEEQHVENTEDQKNTAAQEDTFNSSNGDMTSSVVSHSASILGAAAPGVPTPTVSAPEVLTLAEFAAEIAVVPTIPPSEILSSFPITLLQEIQSLPNLQHYTSRNYFEVLRKSTEELVIRYQVPVEAIVQFLQKKYKHRSYYSQIDYLETVSRNYAHLRYELRLSVNEIFEIANHGRKRLQKLVLSVGQVIIPKPSVASQPQIPQLGGSKKSAFVPLSQMFENESEFNPSYKSLLFSSAAKRQKTVGQMIGGGDDVHLSSQAVDRNTDHELMDANDSNGADDSVADGFVDVSGYPNLAGGR